MIHYLVSEEGSSSVDIFLCAEPALYGRVVVLPYERATEKAALRPGVYIFSDLDRLEDAELRRPIELWRRLSELGPDVKLLNDPTRSLGRYALLRMLHDEGINRFNVFRIPPSLPSDQPIPLRFPVFLRDQFAHTTGRLSELLHSWEEVRNAIRGVLGRPRRYASGTYSPENLLIVEWCDTSDAAGVFRKYSAFVIEGTIIARELLFSPRWVLKGHGLVDAEHLREARAYVAENPHASFLQDVARRANIDYGRFDYALLDGRPQVWEINLNPMIVSHPPGESEISVERLSLELHRVPLRRIATAIEALDRTPQQRQSFDDRLRQELDAASAPRPLALCMLAVEDLRHTNERHGEPVDDRLLLEVARCLRRGAEVFRVGADEFALLLPARHEPRALAAAEAALERIRSLDSVPGEPIRVSAGLALYPTHANDPSELVRAANDALSVAKRDGKNRVHIFVPPSPRTKTRQAGVGPEQLL